MKSIAAFVLAALIAASCAAPALADDRHDAEAQIGAQEYAALLKKGEIVSRSSAANYYALLDPIAARIGAIADPQYDFPFHFILVHEKQPNAFAVPGGSVYVTDSLMKFVQNKEELAGVLCHETSHDIHHDVVNNNAKDQTLGAVIGLLGALTGLSSSSIGQLGENAAYTLQSNRFSRTVESAADRKGAQTCAQAGFNPWGMVWLFRNFEAADTGGSMEVLSDHPNDQHRIAALENQFASDPQLFGSFSRDIATATPLGSSTTRGVTAAHPYSQASPAAPPESYCCAPH